MLIFEEREMHKMEMINQTCKERKDEYKEERKVKVIFLQSTDNFKFNLLEYLKKISNIIGFIEDMNSSRNDRFYISLMNEYDISSKIGLR
jgi:hypothetical protein